MNLELPSDLEQTLRRRAEQRQISIEDLVREAISWYIQMDPTTLDELSAWQEVRDEALELIEEPPA